ncbi:hypothetical protein [Schinkia azotoformans]|uniref:hypothetical protein n=1 Tax=Schinkia azotoformans TaxID=1454 RepID=UPI002DBAC430|nr:hypothetical protein [Schinkia azotoformans]MEC1780096.1 hypothetical protein [Schinkia azotoformans]MED4330825.1 hypothetical protein [Schinkia azotoformans]
MKEVKVLFDLESGTVEQQVFLIDEGNVMYFDDFDNSIYLQGVVATEKEDIYKVDGTALLIIGVYDQPVKIEQKEIERVVKLMKNMTLYDYIINHFDRSEGIDDMRINKI